MTTKSLKDVRAALAGGHTVVPLVRELAADTLTPVAAFLRLARGEDRSFLLESVEGGERVARYSFLGVRPAETLAVREGRALLRRPDGSESPLPGEPLEALGRRLARWRAPREPGLPRFCGGAVGWVGYELAGRLEPTARLRAAEGDEARLMVFQRAVAFDHARRRILLIANVAPDGQRTDLAFRESSDALDDLEERLGRPERPPVRGPGRGLGRQAQGPRTMLGDAAFLAGVARLKRHIRAGDIFQAVLSERFETPLRGHPFSVYRALRSLNPSPYMFYVASGDETVLGASPEMLVRVEDGTVETRPIAGTRPRGLDEREDARLEASLRASVKERAEHLMLVDLGRNDVGRVARPGSVRVGSFMEVERYSHVMHLVSSVTGRLKAGLTPWDAFGACFPAGTVTGAPKIRAMQLVAGLEPRPRGAYAGAVVYCDFQGNLDSCIAIRSLFVQGGVARAQAGAGVVADSSPRRELAEVKSKAAAVLEAVRLAGLAT
ncbi:MAG: anthranilate synthase component I family protein [Elusimicrobia bacterium]|nr:anthranilate synthase component I family protein [Elusimicrobiota bacterium]